MDGRELGCLPFSQSLWKMGVSLNDGFPPKSSIFNRVFHYFHHPFWGKHPYFRKPPNPEMARLSFECLASWPLVFWPNDDGLRPGVWRTAGEAKPPGDTKGVPWVIGRLFHRDPYNWCFFLNPYISGTYFIPNKSPKQLPWCFCCIAPCRQLDIHLRFFSRINLQVALASYHRKAPWYPECLDEYVCIYNINAFEYAFV